MAVTSPGKALRAVFESEKTSILPFAALPVHAQMAQAAGYDAFEVSGGMSAWWAEGASDTGWLTLTEVVAHAKRVARSVDIPVYCDADTGFGPSPLNVQRTVAEFIDAGVAGIHIEDQREPKKSGGETGIELVSDAEAIGRLNAAVEARDKYDKDFVIVARTDGYGAAGGGVEEAIRRAQLYRAETDIDYIFFEGFHTWEQTELALKETAGVNYANGISLIGRRTVAEMTAVGQAIMPTPFAVPGIHEVWRLLTDMKESGEATPFAEYLDRMNAERDTKYDVGWGAKWGLPLMADVRELEEKFLPEELRRDYENSVNVGDRNVS
ncbi:isocitrate lyase/PEP mutase family protein [Arthrobacter sp. I2-34]|uniref:Isocitrate lyase/PEP mutase family protein n=1 Tax=Arthrobacter hankyongi TaxID=2904801 RepID=A0ABS9LDI0_9MICC|nr:isocitrate lyase/PEP mutase family protein [Arthrobacter hankyongi]MCG2624730.1 isocitrate lyase/PEP mutase family protein [Arthrobacter hankyongi]